MSMLGGAASELPLVAGPEDSWKAGRLALDLPVFDAAMKCAEACERFQSTEGQIAAAIVGEDGAILGIVNRLKFLAHYSQRYVPELYGRRSILKLANRQPFLVDEDTPIADLAASIGFDHPEALRECFVVTRAGRYLGIGTGEELVRSKVSLLTEREAQLSEALAVARDAARTKSNFLALMSHELRTPLNAIIGFSEVLACEMFGPHANPRYGEYAQDIHNAGRHLLRLINDILDLSKAEAGRLELDSEPISLPEFFADGIRLLLARARQGEVAMSSMVPAGFPLLEADALRFKQMLLNLLSNAVKFTMPGGSVTVSAGRHSDGGIVVGVSDSGIGMAEEAIPLALEPFRQIASPMSRRVEGTGLGLSLVKSLIERHGGSLIIHSVVDRGTTVQLRFPAGRTLAPREAGGNG